MNTASLFVKFREHELEMNKLSVQENEDKHVRTIALKTVGNINSQHSSDAVKKRILTCCQRSSTSS